MQKPLEGEIDIPVKDQVVIEWGTVTGYILELITQTKVNYPFNV